jgi:hypothetical protein
MSVRRAVLGGPILLQPAFTGFCPTARLFAQIGVKFRGIF